MVFTRNQYKIGREAMFKKPQSNLGTLLSNDNDIRREILDYLDHKDFAVCCMLTKETYSINMEKEIQERLIKLDKEKQYYILRYLELLDLKWCMLNFRFNNKLDEIKICLQKKRIL